MNEKISFKLVLTTLKYMILLNLAYLFGMTLFRLAFFFRFSGNQELNGYMYDILRAFYMGVRFDLVVVSYVTGLVTLTFLIVWAINNLKVFRVWLAAVKWYYFVMFSLIYFILCVDFGFFSYFKNHINVIVFGVIEDDTHALFTGIAQDYNLFVIGAGLILLFASVYFIANYCIRRIRMQESGQDDKSAPLMVALVIGVVLISGNFIAARGSFGLFPLGTMNADISANAFINKLCLNGITTFEEAVDFRLKESKGYNLIKTVGYENDIAGAFSDYLGVPKENLNENLLDNLKRQTRQNPAAERLKPNVILVVMESFGSDLMRYNSDSFNVLGELKKHFDSDYLFKNFLSGDVGTLGSLETIMLNIARRPKSRFISQSKYGYNEYPSAVAMPYKKAGYETIFLYGGDIGWRNMNVFAPGLGFDIVEGEGSMDKSYDKNQWGVYDEFLFDHIYKRLSADPEKPKFIMVMTTTNHPPYSLPNTYNAKSLVVPTELEKRITGDKKLTRMRFATYQYACQKAGEFISKIKDSKFSQNTIIALTGDHNFWDVFNYTGEESAIIDSVPFYICLPQGLKVSGYDPKAFGSHTDIMPTLYSLSLSGKEYTALGRDMFEDPKDSVAFNVDGIVMNKGGLVWYNIGSGTASYYSWDPKKPRLLVRSDPDENHQKMIKHYRAALALTEYMVRNPVKK